MLRSYLFFSCIILLFFIRVTLASINKHESPYRIGYNSELGTSKNHMKFDYGGNILEVDYGNYNENTGIGTDVDNGGNSLPGRNNTFSKHIKMSWQEYQENTIKKTRDININSSNKNLYQFNEVRNFSQYVKLDWQSPWNAPLGQTFTFFASTRGDVSRYSAFDKSSSEKTVGDVSLFPKTGVEWSGPFIPVLGNNISFQPSGKLIAEPPAIGNAAYPVFYGINNASSEGGAGIMPNAVNNNLTNSGAFQEDGLMVGNRAIYGGKITTTLDPLGTVNFSLGQSYYLSNQNSKNEFQGTNPHFSEYTGHIEASPLSWLSLDYRFRLDQKSLVSNFSEVGVTMGPPVASLSGTYTVMHKHAETNKPESFKTTDTQAINKQMTTKQLNLFLTSQVLENWFFMGSLMQDLHKQQTEGKAFQYGIGADYHTARFRVGLTVNRQFYPGMGSKPGTLFMLTFALNNEGEYVSAPMHQYRNSTPANAF